MIILVIILKQEVYLQSANFFYIKHKVNLKICVWRT